MLIERDNFEKPLGGVKFVALTYEYGFGSLLRGRHTGPRRWRDYMQKFLTDESGATALEYTLIMTLMAIGLLTAMPLLTEGVLGNANKVANILK